jgi:hypothetical protein
MHLHQGKLGDTGGPQYWLQAMPKHVSSYLRQVKTCPVILQTPYGPVETPFVAVEPKHKLVGGKIVKANADHFRIQKGQSKLTIKKEEPEKITTAAVRLTNGTVYTGLFHAYAVEKAHNAHTGQSQSYYGRLFNKSVDGYMTSKGRFVDRFEAYKIAIKGRQITRKSYEDAVKELWGENIKSEGALCSLAFNNVRTDNK